MNLTKDQKKQKSQDLASEITASGTLFFTAYQGLKFVDMAELRKQLAPAGAKFRVERNAIVDHAIRQANIEGADEKLFQGPTAIAVGGDIAAVAKTLVDFQKKFTALKLRACYSDGVWYNEDQVKQLATMVPKKKTCPSWPVRCTTRSPSLRKCCKLRYGILPTLSKPWKTNNKANSNVRADVGCAENGCFCARKRYGSDFGFWQA